MPKDTKRATQAAKEMYLALMAGHTFEVPAALSKDDVVTQAVLILRKKHPNVVAKMLQSRGLVLTIGKSAAVSEGAWKHLEAGGYFPKDEVPDDVFFAQHAGFMRRADLDPDEQVKKAQDENRELNAIVIGGR